MNVDNHFQRLLVGLLCPRGTMGKCRRPYHDQAARHADRKREGGLSSDLETKYHIAHSKFAKDAHQKASVSSGN
jgi:hypothetical protein